MTLAVRIARRRLARVFRLAGLALVTLLLLVSNSSIARAGIYSVRLLPTVSQVSAGTSFAVELKTNMVVDTAATGRVQGTITYPADIVQLVSIVPGGYPEIALASGDGLITISSPDKGAGNGYGGQQVLFTATFKAVAGGTATFAANNGAMVVNGTNHVVVAGTVDVLGCPPGYSGVYPSCTSPAGSGSTQSSGSSQTSGSTGSSTSSAGSAQVSTSAQASSHSSTPSTKVTVNVPQTSGTSNVRVTQLTADATSTSLHVTLRTSEPVHDIRLHYGLSAETLNADATVAASGSSLEYELHGLIPSSLYYIQISALDSSGKDLNYQAAYKTRGYPTRVQLAGSGLILAKRAVQVDSKTYHTNADGAVTLMLDPGDHTVSDTRSGTGMKITVRQSFLASGQEPDTQAFTLQLAAARSDSRPMPLPLALSLVAALTLIGGYVYLVRHRHGAHSDMFGTSYWDIRPSPSLSPHELQPAPVVAVASRPADTLIHPLTASTGKPARAPELADSEDPALPPRIHQVHKSAYVAIESDPPVGAADHSEVIATADDSKSDSPALRSRRRPGQHHVHTKRVGLQPLPEETEPSAVSVKHSTPATVNSDDMIEL